MKTKLLILLGFLSLITAGCNIPDGDFRTQIPVVRNKTQDYLQQEKHVALYTVKCYNINGVNTYTVKLILPENFAQVNQHLYFNGTNMFAGPVEIESNTTK